MRCRGAQSKKRGLLVHGGCGCKAEVWSYSGARGNRTALASLALRVHCSGAAGLLSEGAAQPSAFRGQQAEGNEGGEDMGLLGPRRQQREATTAHSAKRTGMLARDQHSWQPTAHLTRHNIPISSSPVVRLRICLTVSYSILDQSDVKAMPLLVAELGLDGVVDMSVLHHTPCACAVLHPRASRRRARPPWSSWTASRCPWRGPRRARTW